MASLTLSFLLLLNYSVRGFAQDELEPLQVKPSTQLFGPDGPWQAVSIYFGDQPLNLYPGGVWESTILTEDICQEFADEPCGTGGLFVPLDPYAIFDKSDDYENRDSGNTSNLPYVLTYGALLYLYSNSTLIMDQLQIANHTVQNLSATTYSSLKMVYSGSEYPIQVGELALGPVANQSFNTGGPGTNASLVPGTLDSQGIIPSNSYGLHVGIGAEAHKLDLSLNLGGYDASRIVGNVSHQPVRPETDDLGNEFGINLLDIAIGVDHGASPFSYSSKEGLLNSGNSSITSSGVQVIMNPLAPYLSLPNSTCAAIAKELSVTYNTNLSLYFWNVTDPQYANVVTSPTYLSFVFDGSSGNITIKVPFQLLNLTLQAPLVSQNTSYFPCQPPQGNTGEYSLGRAFLQAAFIGVNWVDQGKGDWYLAQAPGPNIGPNEQPKAILKDVPKSGLSSNWSETWNGHWTALQEVSSPTPNPPAPPENPSAPPKPPHSLPGGTIAGIVVGCVCAVLIAVGIGILIFIRTRRGNSGSIRPTMHEKDDRQILSPQAPHYSTVMDTVAEEPVRELPPL